MGVNDRQVGGSHYRAELQHWDLIEEAGAGYLEGCATKYVTRWRKKAGQVDLEKALHFVDKLHALAAAGRRGPRGEATPEALRLFARSNGLNPVETEIVSVLTSRWDLEKLQWARQLVLQLLKEAQQGNG